MIKNCLVCNTKFETNSSVKTYCSNSCGGRARDRRFRLNNPDKVLKKRLLENSDVAKRMYYRVKCRAKSSGIPFDITPEDIVIPEKCPVLGITLVFMNQGSGYHNDSPSLDKIHPKLGYVKGNVRVISARANLLKNDATVAELEKVLNDLRVIQDG